MPSWLDVRILFCLPPKFLGAKALLLLRDADFNSVCLDSELHARAKGGFLSQEAPQQSKQFVESALNPDIPSKQMLGDQQYRWER